MTFYGRKYHFDTATSNDDGIGDLTLHFLIHFCLFAIRVFAALFLLYPCTKLMEIQREMQRNKSVVQLVENRWKRMHFVRQTRKK